MKMVRRLFLASAAVAVLLAGSPVLAGDSGKKGPSSKSSPVAVKATAPNRLAEFRITARDGDITPGTLQVKKGDRVRLTFVSKDKTYGVKIKQFGVAEKVKPGNPITVEFVANETGEFPLRCTKYWGFKHWTSNGKIVVR
jgi:heme/copper-type cytochrome/quinol oxidase subunit 2